MNLPAEQGAAATAAASERLASLLGERQRPFVLTGAGLSTESGIPDYRDAAGGWKRRPPIQYREFLHNDHARRRYWARSMVGWQHVRAAHPNGGHHGFARLERGGRLHWLVTQNVDGLHQRAGSRRVTDLHGRLDVVACLECGHRMAREHLQDELLRRNPGWDRKTPEAAPDGDVDIESADFDAFYVPDCPCCGGMLKPEVVFFGESVPAQPVATAFTRLEEADLLLVAGSSLMVWSGYRFVRHAARIGIPVVVLNLGRTRGDREATVKLEAPCGDTLTAVADALGV
ncbi:NAD-dependent protein deacetylase [Aquisalimonas lutea]|uniref:NAD-dependent protein deacetylase n=1 Tax=Aquisalimonas lutea TaxID=1327750 RepID=UPI0025B3C07D|nr:NAD-dependent protein deacetylase [Aquisalimonas lutea]MDN3517045.1 NAD-dependent protein deacetylase [Aquisalimonas lutea]